MRQHPTGCMCLGWVGSLPYTRRGRTPVGQSLLWSEGSGFSQGQLQPGWVQVGVSGSAAPLLRPAVFQYHACFSLQSSLRAWGEPGERRAAGTVGAQQCGDLPGTGALEQHQSFQWCRKNSLPLQRTHHATQSCVSYGSLVP